VVAYFTQGKHVAGTSEFTLKWHGAVWRFASAEDLRLFKENPEKYAPQYGGYCAFAMAGGDVADIDPEAWAIVDGRLYLHCSLAAREAWLKDPQGYIKRADSHWPGVLER
jgi:YHS domain-containing protein